MPIEHVPAEPDETKSRLDGGAGHESAAERPDSPTPAPHSAAQALGAAQTALHDELQPARLDPFIGRVLDERYRISERLGEGGMGAVFVAEHLKLRKSVAIKMIRAELAGNGEVAARFAREAMATAQFEHPHVASAIDYGTLAEGGAYLVMQLVRGKSLRDLIDQRGRLPWPVACELLAQVADALSAARLAGIVHRDLKPENILVEVREDGSYLAKILDFGIAHVAPQTAADSGEVGERALTRVGTVMGTPGYMSPEQAVGDRVDHRTDLYALGVVLWECVAGRGLWDGPDVTSIITKQLREEVPRLRDVLGDPSLPRALDEIVQRLCARMPEARPDHAGTVRDELRALSHHTVTKTVLLKERASQLVEFGRARFLALPPASRALFAAGVGAVLLALLALIAGGPGAHSNEFAVHGLTPVEAERLQPSAANPSLTERARALAERMVAREASDKPEAKSGIPSELAAEVKQLDAPRSSERRRAAQKILQYKAQNQIAPYVLAVARLERARSCRERKEVIADMSELKDERCLPALHRLAEAPHTGCGFLRLGDCNACIRNDLRRAIEQLDTR